MQRTLRIRTYATGPVYRYAPIKYVRTQPTVVVPVSFVYNNNNNIITIRFFVLRAVRLQKNVVFFLR